MKTKIWNASRICVSSLRRGHANLLCIVPILIYVLPEQAQLVCLVTTNMYSSFPSSTILVAYDPNTCPSLSWLKAPSFAPLTFNLKRYRRQGRCAMAYKTVAGAYKGCHNRWLCGAHSQQTTAIISFIYERTHPPNQISKSENRA